MNKFLLTFLLLFINITAALAQCTPSGNSGIYFKDEDGNVVTKYAPGPNRDSPTPQWVAKCAPKVVEIAQAPKKKQTCGECFAQYSGRDRYAYCVRGLDCPSNGSANLLFDMKNLTFDSAPMISSCEEAMFCSEETRFCQFICPETYTYNISSGFCERPCQSNEIIQGNECVACPVGKKAENNICVNECPDGQVNNGNGCEEIGSLSSFLLDLIYVDFALYNSAGGLAVYPPAQEQIPWFNEMIHSCEIVYQVVIDETTPLSDYPSRNFGSGDCGSPVSTYMNGYARNNKYKFGVRVLEWNPTTPNTPKFGPIKWFNHIFELGDYGSVLNAPNPNPYSNYRIWQNWENRWFLQDTRDYSSVPLNGKGSSIPGI